MPTSERQRVKELYEFGPFRVDPEKEILLRAGEPVPLTPKTFQILLVLVRHGRELVTKENLMRAVWPDTFVEEGNLSRNIFMLRKALGESPQEHRYVLTVPGRGYRFAQSVRLVSEQDLEIATANHSTIQSQVRRPGLWPWVILAGTLALAASSLWFFSHRKTLLTNTDTIVLADFGNSTGDPIFDGTLRRGLAVQLEQSPFLSLLSDDRVQQVLRLMDMPSDAPLTPALAREVCERTGSVAMLEGSISRLGSQYVLGLRARNCRTGEILDDELVQAARKEDTLDALSQLATRLRGRVGESLSTLERRDVPLAEATTRSLDALKAYSIGHKVLSSNGSAAALPHFLRATEMDPQFAMAYAYLGRTYGDIGESALSAENTGKAYQLRDRASDPERFFISASYDTQVTGNVEKAQQTCELWERTYPREITPHALLAGLIYQVSGQYARSVEESQKALELDPDFAIAYDILAYSNESLGQVEEAERALKRAKQRSLDIPWFLLHHYRIAFLKADTEAMERVAAQAQTSESDEVLSQQAFVLAYSGRMKQARRTSRRAIEMAVRKNQKETAALWEAGAAVREAFLGDVPEARKSAAEALGLSRNREVEYGVAMVFALSNDPISSETLARDLEKRFPEDTSVQLSYLPTLRALLDLDQGKPAKAIELLEVSVPHELRVPGSSIHGYFGALYPVYVRGEAYLAKHRGAEAAAEFRKILDHRGIVLADPVGALAQLQFGRALALSGDKAGAKTAYHEFLSLWKDADPDIAIFKQAKAEYIKLN
jgi:DNA-binding winged helix-turn-helix (wHTH) protein/predicted Zn-dependent protease